MALEVFLSSGFDGASMETIATTAGISKGTLYARYENKEALFRVVIEEQLLRWSRRAGPQGSPLPETLAERMRHHAAVLIWVFQWPEYQRMTRLIETSSITMPEIARLWLELGARQYVRYLADDFAKAVDAGGFSPQDFTFMANTLLFGVSGWYRSESSVREVSQQELDEFVNRMVRSLLAQ